MSAEHNRQLIETFYTAFAKGDAEGMARCYTDDVLFHDPAFGELRGEEARNMWRMLIGRSGGQINIAFSDVQATATSGSAHWIASYTFTQTNRDVVNRIHASFEFRDGKIARHTDVFSMWKWSRQALGFKGWLLGWSPLVKKAVRKQTTALLRKYSAQKVS
jgi:ketosteroid isomerase-like protein